MAEVIIKEVTAATAVVGYKFVLGQQAKRPYNRIIYGMLMNGSTAAGDTEVVIRVGTEEKARLRNGATGLSTATTIVPVRIFVPANQEIEVEVVDAAATNPVVLELLLM